MSDYFFAKTIDMEFDKAIQAVTEKLKEKGFGVLTEIDVKSTLKKKINVDFRRYTILGACNPEFAYKALSVEENIGVMLPCNVVVKEAGTGMTEVVAVDPVSSMQAIENKQLEGTANTVSDMLKSVIDEL